MSLRFLKLAPAMLFSGLCACACQTSSVDHDILARGNAPGEAGAGARFEVIESQAELIELYDKLFAGRLPPPEAPDIDFSRSVVLFVAMDRKPTAGYRIEMAPPVLQGETLKSQVIFHEPAGEKARATVMTRPFALMKAARPAGAESVLFVDGEGEVLARIALE